MLAADAHLLQKCYCCMLSDELAQAVLAHSDRLISNDTSTRSVSSVHKGPPLYSNEAEQERDFLLKYYHWLSCGKMRTGSAISFHLAFSTSDEL